MAEPQRAPESPTASATVTIVGAGPAGLTAARELERLGRHAEIFERDVRVGGISQTVEYRGFRFDLGGHRFFTKSGEVQDVWTAVLGEDFLERPRLSRIFYRGHFFDYPLKPLNALAGLGAIEALRVLGSFARVKLVPLREQRTFEQWVVQRFGRRLFEIFFKTYTEKVWGMPCSEISADWAAQRIQNLDLRRAVTAALFGSGRHGAVTSLIHRFHYPRHGPGMMWERCAEQLAAAGSPTRLGAELVRIGHRDGRVTAVDLRDREGGVEEREVDHLICSIPLGRVAQLLDPPPPAEVLAAAAGLRHRDFLTVVLVIDEANLFPDNWIYVHEPTVRVGRIQNFKNWSPEMVPDAASTALGLEYFVQRGDELWESSDDALIALATREIAELGLAKAGRVVDGAVVRVPNAYPVYDDGYRERVRIVRDHLETLSNLQMIGRNGQHRYNNQDHSMLTGMHAARNVVAPGTADVWDVNLSDEYHEATSAAKGDRLVPAPTRERSLEEHLADAFARFDPVALGGAVAIAAALLLFAATAAEVLSGAEGGRGPALSLLAIYLSGYDVSWRGALIGTVEAGALGFLLGGAIAGAINALIGAIETALRRELADDRAVEPLRTDPA